MHELVRHNQVMPISAPELVALLSDPIEALQNDVARMREEYHAPYDVTTTEAFFEEALRFHQYVMSWVAVATVRVPGVNHPVPVQVVYRPETAFAELRGWYGADLDIAERHARFHREGGGFIGVIDKMTETILRERVDAYMELVFLQYIPRDQHARIRLAEEIIAEYRRFLPDDPDLQEPGFLAVNLRPKLKELAVLRSQLRKAFRW